MKKIILMTILLMICFTVAGCSKKTTVKVVDRNDIYNIEEIIENSEKGSGFNKVNNDKYYLYDVDSDGLDEVLVPNYKFINGTICYYIDCYNAKKNTYYEISDLDDKLSYELMIYKDELYVLGKNYDENYESNLQCVYSPVEKDGKVVIQQLNKGKQNKVIKHLSAKEIMVDDIADIESIREELDNGTDFNYLSGQLYFADLNYDGRYEIYSSSSYSKERTTYFIECYDPVEEEYSVIHDPHHRDYHIVLFNDLLYTVIVPKDIDYKSRPVVEKLVYTHLGVLSSFISTETSTIILNSTQVDEKQNGIVNSNIETSISVDSCKSRMITNNEMKYITKEYNDIEKNRMKNDCTYNMHRADLDGDGKWELYITRKEGIDLITAYIECYNQLTNAVSEINERGKTDYCYFVYKDELYVEASSRDSSYNKQYLRKIKIYKPYLFNGVLDLSKISNDLEKEIIHYLYPYKNLDKVG